MTATLSQPSTLLRGVEDPPSLQRRRQSRSFFLPRGQIGFLVPAVFVVGRFATIFALTPLPSSILGQTSGLICEEKKYDESTVVCTFEVHKDWSGALDPFRTCVQGGGDEMCVEALVTVVQRDETEDHSTKKRREETDDVDLKIGAQIYRSPFSQYGNEVQAVLLRHQDIFLGNQVAKFHPFKQGQAYLELGQAHNLQMGQLFKAFGDGQSMIRLALNAFESAKAIYSQVDDSKEDSDLSLHCKISVIFHMGETYAFSTVEEHNKLAIEYFIQAQRAYKNLLDRVEISSYLSRKDVLDDIRMGWAHCCLAIGVSLISGSDDYDSQLAMDIAELKQTQEKSTEAREQLLSYGSSVSAENAQEAQLLFTDSANVFRKMIEEQGNRDEPIELQRQLANALQNLATAAVLQGNFKSGSEASEEALSVLMSILDQSPHDSADHEDVLTSVGEILIGLSEYYLQQGKYDQSHEKYKAAMKWYQSHRQLQALSAPLYALMSENDTLEKYEMILEDYYALLEDQSNMADADEHFDDQNEYYYEKNDAYEGDLHATLGALYLARGDIGTAQSSFLRAAELYESAGEGGNQASAEVQFNLATTSFQNREYDASIAYHHRGVAIYRSLVVEGDSPMVDGLYNVEFVEGVPEPVKESKAKERTVEHRPKKDDKAKPNQPIIHIDVNQYARQMLLNASSSKEEL